MNRSVRFPVPGCYPAGVGTRAADTPSRGRIDKRRAIVAAAFTVFARNGYEQACVRDIAEAAGVAKPTVYNHLADKQSLLREALVVTADEVGTDCAGVIDRLRDPGADLRITLEDTAYRLLRLCGDERSQALRRLTYAQGSRFPELLALVRGRTATRTLDALTDRFGLLALSGRLRITDPAVAGEQFLALLTGPLENRSQQGTRKVPAAQLRDIATAAVRTFLAAYGNGED